jgi:hypothetical protein
MIADDASDAHWRTPPRPSVLFDKHTIAEIHRAAATGIYDIRGFGAKRALPHFDDLLFLGASMSRYPLEDLVALTVEAAAMAQVPLAGTDWIPGQGRL